MNATNKKPYINISQLIDNYQSSKKKSLQLSRPTSQQTNYEGRCRIQKENQSSQVNRIEKPKHNRVCIKLDLQSDFSTAHNTERQRELPTCAIKESTVKPLTSSEAKQQFKFLQKLITSNKMFINPDKWQSFMQSCKGDTKFHKALSSFLYSYFIEHYQ